MPGRSTPLKVFMTVAAEAGAGTDSTKAESSARIVLDFMPLYRIE
jgi:hypothetical protein